MKRVTSMAALLLIVRNIEVNCGYCGYEFLLLIRDENKRKEYKYNKSWCFSVPYPHTRFHRHTLATGNKGEQMDKLNDEALNLLFARRARTQRGSTDP
jgi:hypothetical protein